MGGLAWSRNLKCAPVVKVITGMQNRVKDYCRHLTTQAVSRGEIKKLPCSVCGSNKSEAHHLDYSDPMLLEWLCREHHQEWHKRHKAIAPVVTQEILEIIGDRFLERTAIWVPKDLHYEFKKLAVDQRKTFEEMLRVLIDRFINPKDYT